MPTTIAVDIGGTQLRAASYTPDSLTPLHFARTTTQPSSPSDLLTTPLERLQALIASIWPADDTVNAISVAAPGPTNPYQGIIYEAPNIPGWINIFLSQTLEERFHVPVLLGNDANLAALGEWKFGVGRGHHNLIYLTISTGIGGGVIVDDRLLLGAQGLAAELGHITVMPDGPMCGCGHRGHLEAFSSGTGIANWVKEQISQGVPSSLPKDCPLTARMVSEAAKQGDHLSIMALERAGSFLGRAIADFLHIFNPTLIILGGGVSKSGPLFLNPLRASLAKGVMNPHYLDNLELAEASFGDQVGLIGALALAVTR